MASIDNQEVSLRTQLLHALADLTNVGMQQRGQDESEPRDAFNAARISGLPNLRAWLPRAVQHMVDNGLMTVAPAPSSATTESSEPMLFVVVTLEGLAEAKRTRGY